MEQEPKRLEALHVYDVLDTAPEQVFDEMARLAASIVVTPIALVSLVNGNRQWFKAKIGLTVPGTPRDVELCAHVIGSSEVFVISDATQDARFAATARTSRSWPRESRPRSSASSCDC